MPARHRVVLLPGSVLPAEPAYAALLDVLGERVDAVAKDLEVYAAPSPRLRRMAAPFLPEAEWLRTARLVLEPLEPAHAAEMAAVLDDPLLHTYVGGRPLAEEELRMRYERQARGLSEDESERWLNWIVRNDRSDEALGYLQATVAVASGVADVAWVIGSPFQGNGYAREAASAMVAWLRSQGVMAVTAHIHPDNAASQRVATAIGLVATSVIVAGEVIWRA